MRDFRAQANSGNLSQLQPWTGSDIANSGPSLASKRSHFCAHCCFGDVLDRTVPSGLPCSRSAGKNSFSFFPFRLTPTMRQGKIISATVPTSLTGLHALAILALSARYILERSKAKRTRSTEEQRNKRPRQARESQFMMVAVRLNNKTASARDSLKHDDIESGECPKTMIIKTLSPIYWRIGKD